MSGTSLSLSLVNLESEEGSTQRACLRWTHINHIREANKTRLTNYLFALRNSHTDGMLVLTRQRYFLAWRVRSHSDGTCEHGIRMEEKEEEKDRA